MDWTDITSSVSNLTFLFLRDTRYLQKFNILHHSPDVWNLIYFQPINQSKHYPIRSVNFIYKTYLSGNFGQMTLTFFLQISVNKRWIPYKHEIIICLCFSNTWDFGYIMGFWDWTLIFLRVIYLISTCICQNWPILKKDRVDKLVFRKW